VGWRGSFSGGLGFAWLIFIIIWLAFFAFESFYKNVAVFLLSILVLVLIYGTIWGSWGIKKIPPEGKELMKQFGFRWRVILSIIIPIATLCFLIYWFWFLAETMQRWYQNVAILLVAILIMGGIMAVVWGGYKRKCGRSFDEMGKDFEKIGEEIGKNIEKEFEKKEE
jgi:ethanolamine transporter EutH